MPVPLDAVEVWVFDLDNTLYPAHCRLFDQVDWRMTEYIAAFLGVDKKTARARQKALFRHYGSSLRGLMVEHDMPPLPYLDFVHDIDLTAVLADPALDAALAALPGRKVIFTNGSERHAANITGHLGIAHHFDLVFDVAAAGYVPKPHPAPYARLLSGLGAQPARALMIEDIARNLKPAAALGMTTAWLRGDSDWSAPEGDRGHIHHVVDDLASWLAAGSETRAGRG